MLTLIAGQFVPFLHQDIITVLCVVLTDASNCWSHFGAGLLFLTGMAVSVEPTEETPVLLGEIIPVVHAGR
jgi:hypothetical protein